MVFNDAPVLRTDYRLLLRYVGVTVDNLLEFSVLSGFTIRFGIARSPILTGETLYFANTEEITSLFKQPLDIVYLFGEFQILENFKTNITSLTTAFYYEYFCWQILPSKLVLNL
jgi:hypothetical protein